MPGKRRPSVGLVVLAPPAVPVATGNIELCAVLGGHELLQARVGALEVDDAIVAGAVCVEAHVRHRRRVQRRQAKLPSELRYAGV